jgi:hypothetical protein
MKRLVLNKIRCNKCGDEVESTHRHDFKRCKCGEVAADGGLDYIRRMGGREDFTELSEYEEESIEYVPAEGEENLHDRVLIEKRIVCRRHVDDGYWNPEE